METLTRFSGLSPDSGGPAVGWFELMATFRSIGLRGVEGIAKALQSPHAPTRAIGAHMMTYVRPVKPEGSSEQDERAEETIISLLKKTAFDSNKKLRRFAIDLLELDVGDDRKRREFVPLIVPLLNDCSTRVRRRAAWELQPWASEVPLSTVARALLNEQDAYTRGHMERLLRAALDAQDAVKT
jgi:HEAT repeat protein